MSKFGSLAVNVSTAVKMPIILPGHIEPATDAQGRQAYIEFLPWDSEPGRALDRKRQVEGARKVVQPRSRAEVLKDLENEDAAQEQAERLSVLAAGWHLVGADKEVIELPFNAANARDLFTEPETAWLRRQAWVFVTSEANFMKGSSKA